MGRVRCPGKARLDGPAAGQDLEAIGKVRTIDAPDGQAPDGFQRLPQLGTGISAVGQDVARLGMARSDTRPYIRRAVAAPNTALRTLGATGNWVVSVEIWRLRALIR